MSKSRKPIGQTPDKIKKKEEKHRIFAEELVKNGINATQAYKKINPQVKNTTAGVEGSKLLKNPSVISRVLELLPNDSEDISIIKSAYKATRSSTIDWNVLHKYMSTSLELKGLIGNNSNNNTNTQVNVALVVERDSK